MPKKRYQHSLWIHRRKNVVMVSHFNLALTPPLPPPLLSFLLQERFPFLWSWSLPLEGSPLLLDLEERGKIEDE